MISIKDRIIKSTCMSCGREFWATEDFVSNVQAGNCESVCPLCEEPILMEDDDSEEFDYEEPEPEDR